MIQHSQGRDADVCVVGAGPAGLALARALAAAGRRVSVIESGGFDASGPAQRLNDGDHEGEPYAGLQSTRQRGLGGTTLGWNVKIRGLPGAKYAPLRPADLEDWPIGWDDLAPCYPLAQEACGLGSFDYDAEAWANGSRCPFPLDGTGLASGVYHFGHAERFSRAMVNELRERPGATLVTHATVTRLEIERGRVRGLVARGQDGAESRHRGRAVVLACGAVENARLLLLESRRAGLVPSPWLGRGFMEHARDFSMLLVPEDPRLFARASFYDLHQAAPGSIIGGYLTVTDEARARLGLPNAGITLVPRPRGARRAFGSLLRAVGVTTRGGRYGWSEGRSPGKAFDAFHLVMNLEQRPSRENRVELSDRADPFGNPLPRLVLRWSDESQARLEVLRQRLQEWMGTAGLGRLHLTPGARPDLNAHHHAGTTRMALAPTEGVTDAFGQVFGAEGLYIAGASLFPSAGFANPTLTIVALALRLARHLDETLGRG